MRSLSRAFSLALIAGLAGSIIAPSAVRAEDPPGFAAATAANRMLCVHDVAAGQTLTMRSAASGTATTVAELPAGTCGLKLAGRCEGDWCEMSLAEKKGWVPWRFVGIYEVPSASQSVTARPEPPQPRRSAAAPPPASSAPRAGAPPASSRPSEPPRRTVAASAPAAHRA
ncbi:MAG: hypothetical protein JSS20_21070, partial [Proteobacteria bacterium]|nr:hypothetical protein [Pseudomonadota bacterium]